MNNKSFERQPTLTTVTALILLLSIAFPASSGAADVNSCFVRKMMGYSQVGTNLPVVRPNPFSFAADAYADSSDALREGWIRSPGGTNRPVVWATQQYRLPSFSFREDFATQGSMDAVYPGGSYTIELLTAHDGNRTNTLELPLGGFPQSPWLRNLDAAQGMDPRADFSFTWTSFTGATAADEIQFQLWQQGNPGTLVFSADPFYPATNTFILVPRNTLLYGTGYVGFLVFVKVVQSDTGSYPGARLLSAYDSFTLFTFRTRPPPSLRITINDQIATLAWPLFYDSWLLQELDDPSRPEAGRLVEKPVVPVGDSYNVTVPATNHSSFYRLIHN
ncbi:MAG TPA: hypothetical protein VJA21_10850 [Verrucomicrobiae bacterium]